MFSTYPELASEQYPFTPYNRGIVIATDHFISTKTGLTHPAVKPLLVEIFRQDDEEVDGAGDLLPNVTDRISALWVPGNGVHSHLFNDVISSVANGVATGQMLSRGSSAVFRGRNLRVIYDTALAGGAEAIHKTIEQIRTNYPAPHMTFTVSSAAKPEGIEALQGIYRDVDNVDFLLSTALPEHKRDKTESVFTAQMSEMAEELQMAGVVGYGALARYTKVGQYFLALGVCIYEAEDYVSRILRVGGREGNEDDYVEVVKRMVTPEETFMHAQSTEVTVGRTLFQHNGEYTFPDVHTMTDDKYMGLRNIVRLNLRKLVERMDALPAPTPLEKPSRISTVRH